MRISLSITILLVLVSTSQYAQSDDTEQEEKEAMTLPIQIITPIYDRFRIASSSFLSIVVRGDKDSSSIFLRNNWNEDGGAPIQEGKEIKIIETKGVKKVFVPFSVKRNIWNRYLLWLTEDGVFEVVRLAGTGIRGKKWTFSLGIESQEIIEPVWTDNSGKLFMLLKKELGMRVGLEEIVLLSFDKGRINRFPIFTLNGETRDFEFFPDDTDRLHLIFDEGSQGRIRYLKFSIDDLNKPSFIPDIKDVILLDDGEKIVDLFYTTMAEEGELTVKDYPIFFLLTKMGKGEKVLKGRWMDIFRGGINSLPPFVMPPIEGNRLVDILPVSPKEVYLLFTDSQKRLFILRYGGSSLHPIEVGSDLDSFYGLFLKRGISPTPYILTIKDSKTIEFFGLNGLQR